MGSLVQIRRDSVVKDDNIQISNTWQPPMIGWVKVNVDGALTTTGMAGCGGIIRDHAGNWVAGFTCNLGSCSVIEAEQWAVYRGLQLAWDLRLEKIIIESDSKNVIDLLSKSGNERSSLLVLQIQRFLQLNWETKLQYVARGQNKVADALAKEGLTSTRRFSECPTFLEAMVHTECLGIILH